MFGWLRKKLLKPSPPSQWTVRLLNGEIVFPLEADGRDDFVKWMAAQPGFKDRELAKAMGSTRFARFDVMIIKPKGS